MTTWPYTQVGQRWRMDGENHAEVNVPCYTMLTIAMNYMSWHMHRTVFGNCGPWHNQWWGATPRLTNRRSPRNWFSDTHVGALLCIFTRLTDTLYSSLSHLKYDMLWPICKIHPRKKSRPCPDLPFLLRRGSWSARSFPLNMSLYSPVQLPLVSRPGNWERLKRRLLWIEMSPKSGMRQSPSRQRIYSIRRLNLWHNNDKLTATFDHRDLRITHAYVQFCLQLTFWRISIQGLGFYVHTVFGGQMLSLKAHTPVLQRPMSANWPGASDLYRSMSIVNDWTAFHHVIWTW